MKTTIFILSILFYGSLHAQCPSAGQDSSSVYCPNELFDIADLRTNDADTNGVFIDPMGDTMTITSQSWIFPGQYTYYYLVSDTNCPIDTAKYVILIIQNCTYGLSENTPENKALIKMNPVNESLILNDVPYDLLEIYETSGRRVLSFSTGKSILDVSSLQSGNYLLAHEKNGIRQFQRFQKY